VAEKARKADKECLALTVGAERKTSRIIVDLSSTNHTVSDITILPNLRECKRFITVANGENMNER
jgi:hypothetical protein